jgi:hypothetical protein
MDIIASEKYGKVVRIDEDELFKKLYRIVDICNGSIAQSDSRIERSDFAVFIRKEIKEIISSVCSEIELQKMEQKD